MKRINKIEQVFEKCPADKAALAVVQRDRQKREHDKAEVVEQKRGEDPQQLLFAQGVQQNDEGKALYPVIRIQIVADHH